MCIEFFNGEHEEQTHQSQILSVDIGDLSRILNVVKCNQDSIVRTMFSGSIHVPHVRGACSQCKLSKSAESQGTYTDTQQSPKIANQGRRSVGYVANKCSGGRYIRDFERTLRQVAREI